MRSTRIALLLAIVSAFSPLVVLGQQDRLPENFDPQDRATVTGNMNPKAQAQFDQGPADLSLRLQRVTLMLKPGPEQQTALEKLLGEQEDPASPNYRTWLTPEQYADRFGLSSADVARIVSWLQSQSLTITEVARGRNWIAFSGTVGQVQAAFRVAIHRYDLGGEMHFANAHEPSVPRALAPVVLGILGLDDFHPKPPRHPLRPVSGPILQLVNPQFTNGSNHYLGPDDIATIYHLTPLYNGGYFGNGQSIAVMGQTDIVMSDISDFRTMFNLPATLPTKVLAPPAPVPDIDPNFLEEADLDLEWAGAVARNANLIYVYSNDVFVAVTYAVNNNVAPIISYSFGGCENQNSAAAARSYQHIAQQANAQGITWVAASGDAGAAACNSQTDSIANTGFAVNLPASVPEVTGIGGTEFNEGSGNYWGGTNDTHGGSALSYIPEVAWNDTGATLAATGGGTSIRFSKPAWQVGPGVPADSARDVPDLSLTASANHDGYIFCNNGSCSSQNPSLVTTVIGGTSAPTPVFAGFLALLQQYQVAQAFQNTPGLGNINPTLYLLAQNASNAFQDITAGDNIVPCTIGSSSDCTTGSFGYTAGPGYDRVTGLGSVNAWTLASIWHVNQCTYTLPSPTTVSIHVSAYSLAIGTQSGCPWTGWTNANWITITPSTGTGSGNANLLLAANNSTQPRTGVVYVGGQTFSLTQSPSIAPDLVIMSLTGPTAAVLGAPINVTLTASNQGSVAAPAFQVEFYFSSSPAISTSAIDTGSACSFSGLAAGASAQCSLAIGVPASVTPGVWYLGAIADPTNQVFEQDKSNNTRVADSGPVTFSVPVPHLSIAKSHSGSFTQGQQGASYLVMVTNSTGAGGTSGTVTVTETLPAGLTLVSMGGSGWLCSSTTCTRSDALAGGSSYPTITVVVNVAANAASPQINQVSVSGGGSGTASTTDSTVIAPISVASPSLIVRKTHSGSFSQGQSNAVYTVTVSNATGAGPTSGTVTVTETLPAGLTLASMNGSGWTCASITCARIDTLTAGASYPAITVTVNVAANATSPQINQVSVSGGGSGAVVATDATTITQNQPTLSLSQKSLNFGVSSSLATSPQTIAVSFSNGFGVGWTASSNQPNITVSPTSGAGNGAFQVSAAAGASGTVTVTAARAVNSPQVVSVNVSNVAAGIPYGSFDTPLNNTSGVAGAIPVTGWALDSIEVASVGIYREPIGNEPAQSNGLVYIGNATLVAGARPDVETAYPNAPFNYRAGWGYLLLTNFLPNSGGSPGPGNGTYKLHAITVNRGGQSVDLGTRSITVDNAHASKPFGTIDTPGQGGTASGTAYVNFGWALTQNPFAIPIDGSTITVIVDGVPAGHPTYNQFRSDVANLFPGLANSNGAVGFFNIDTTQLANGVHTISWNVFDNAGRGDGIGSRYFTIANTGTGNVPASEEPIDTGGFASRETGAYSVSMEELDRIELPLGATNGYQIVNDKRRPLPVGSTLKNGHFYWQAGPGFLGGYDLLFVRKDSTQFRVHVNIQPKSYAYRESR